MEIVTPLCEGDDKKFGCEREECSRNRSENFFVLL